jgi:putative endonuclease
MKEIAVYMVICSDGTYYTGVTNNLERRLAEHDSGLNPKAYTHGRRPVKLAWSQVFSDPMQAIAIEKKVKDWSRKKKEALIEQNWDELKALSRKKK